MKNKYQFKLKTEEVNDSHMGLARRIVPGERILELGCSSGYLSRFLREDLGCYVVGVDIDREAIKEAEPFCDRAIVADLDHAIWLEAIAHEKFDTILCADVLEHLKDPVTLLRNLKLFLNSKGRVLASIPNVAHASVRLELLQGHFDYESLGILDDTHLHFYTMNGCITLFMQAGYACTDIAYSIHDLADEVIEESLQNIGLQLTEQARQRFHAADATAFQYIIEAFPAADELLEHKPPILTPKPLVSSGAFYSLLVKDRDVLVEHNRNHEANIKELDSKVSALERMVNILEHERDDLLEHNANHLKHIEALSSQAAAFERERDAERVHNQNHLAEIANWVHTGRLLDDALFNLTLQVEALAADKQGLMNENEHLRTHFNKEITALRHHIEYQKNQIEHLEGVLHRVHSKISYRAIRFIKNTPHSLLSNLKRLPAPEIFPVEEAPVVLAENDDPHNYQAWLARFNENKPSVEACLEELNTWTRLPKIAIVMPTFNPTKECLEEAIESVLAQIYPHWELCIADDASTYAWVREVLQHYAEDSRIKVVYRTENGHISRASNSAMELVSAEYVALMDHDDMLTPDALYWVAKTILEHPTVELIYSDEDKLNIEGERYGPYFKTDWNPELLLSHNFICHLGVYKTARVRQIEGFDPAFDGAQDYDLALRYVTTISEHDIKHIPRILYHWRATPGSTANGIHEKPYAEPLIRKAVQRALLSKGIKADVSMHSRLSGALRVQYHLPDVLPLVTIVIPTFNGFSLLKRCIESILTKTDYANYEILIIDNGSDDWVTQRYLAYLQQEERISVLRDDSPFNYAALNNNAVTKARGDIIALLNNDLEVINNDWLREMVSYVLHPEVGAVGAKLYYPNDLIQHAGVIIGLGGVAGHSHKHFPRDSAGYCGRLLLTQNLSAVTAACLVVRKAVFEEVGGFDAVNLSVAFNDVDFCLRIQEVGYRNVWTPYAELYHHESATRGYEDTPEKQARFTKEVDYMKRRWATSVVEDAAYNPNLTVDREDFSFAFPPRV